ncbi:MAG: hypothetical protein JXC85_06440 [Candidatus Aenigmarchaeota archaeon]|nr:hypothetical protein [Candidatus Aenigmarchaeota archaeon]
MQVASYDRMSRYGPDVALDVLGPNVIRSLVAAIPGFFGGDYVVAKLLPKPDNQQSDLAPVTWLEPVVLESTHSKYPIGTVIDYSKGLPGLMRDDINLAISPVRVRGIGVSQDILEEGPYDNFVIAEIRPDAGGFGKPYVFCRHGPNRTFGRNIRCSTLTKREFAESMSHCYTHFAFVPAGDKRRKSMGIDKGWKVII